ncbi:transposase [Streptomyces minutiscleroticus]|uniref:Insertion element IS402-like domain-containing protein n=1 Tax=Streptomyces minutiscleroticus TaxID=68238 RepID=A0A918U8X0_9ACTN|nr:hypothetical protein GCM10010358_74250 [Streptomyces minutiscleroticus]
MSDELWSLAAPLLSSFSSCPQGRHTDPHGERPAFTAVVYVLASGCAWRHLPDSFGISPATARRRFSMWTRNGLWRQLRQAVLDEPGFRSESDWASAIVDAAEVRARADVREGSENMTRGTFHMPAAKCAMAEGQARASSVRGPVG